MACRARRSEIWASGVRIQCIHGNLSGQDDSGAIRCISDFQPPCISKMPRRRAKRSEIWVSGVGIQCIQGTFEICGLGHFVVIQCISNFRQPYILKTAGRRVKKSESWSSGVSIQCIQGTFDS